MIKKALAVFASLIIIAVCSSFTAVRPAPARSYVKKEADTLDIAEKIEEYLDIITADGEEFDSEKQFIEAHPDEFAGIVALGEEALPYLNKLAAQYYEAYNTDRYSRSIIAMAAAYEIDPGLYDRIYLSPDGNYMLNATVAEFFKAGDPFTGIIYDLSLVECGTGEVKASIKSSAYIDVEWSPDSRYAAVSDKLSVTDDDLFYGMTAVFDVQNENVKYMPYGKFLSALLGVLNRQLDICAYDIWFGDWVCEGCVEIDYRVITDSGRKAVTGRYIYDLVNEKIDKFDFSIVYLEEPRTADTETE